MIFNNLDSVIIFCLLDTQMMYNTVVKNYTALRDADIKTRSDLRRVSEGDIRQILLANGCRFPNQRARNLKAFGDNPIDLTKATRDELVKNVRGIGMKLASMFLNWTRDTDYAILDSHILSWLKEYGLKTTNSYKELETIFQNEAKKRGLSTSRFDEIIWEQRRK